MRYRLLNEPGEAESICRGRIGPGSGKPEGAGPPAAGADGPFRRRLRGGCRARARGGMPRLGDAYERAYYAGIICERQAKARLHQGHPGAGYDAYEFLDEAMSWFEKAETLRPPKKNDDALLHWNTCARFIMGHRLTPRMQETVEIGGD